MAWPRLTFYTDDKHKHYPCRVDSGKLNTNSQDDFKKNITSTNIDRYNMYISF